MKRREASGELVQIIKDAGDKEIDQLAAVFGHFTAEFIKHGENRVELARAMGDQETAVKEQIMLGVMQTARGMFEHSYILVSGSRRSLWDDEQEN